MDVRVKKMKAIRECPDCGWRIQTPAKKPDCRNVMHFHFPYDWKPPSPDGLISWEEAMKRLEEQKKGE